MNKNLKVALFTEAGTKRGLGHLVRSYTIYKKFQSLKINSSFFVDSDIDLSYKFSDLNYFKWQEFCIKESYDIIFIDSYEAKLQIYETISNSCRIAVYLDDYKRLSYPKGVIVNFSPDADSVLYKEKSSLYTYLLGVEYIPIREEFLNLSLAKKEQLFIMLGGSDTANLSTTIAKHLDDSSISKVIVTNSQKTAKELNRFKNSTILFQPSDEELITYMSSSSIAISTASMTLYELAYLQVPTIIIAVSRNQEIGAQTLLRHNLVSQYISIENSHWLKDLSKSLNSLKEPIKSIDNKGAQRVVNKILGLIK